ncbi:10989_t:CDS:2, partial [Racocetra persica]
IYGGILGLINFGWRYWGSYSALPLTHSKNPVIASNIISEKQKTDVRYILPYLTQPSAKRSPKHKDAINKFLF